MDVSNRLKVCKSGYPRFWKRGCIHAVILTSLYWTLYVKQPQLGGIVPGDREARLDGGRITCRFSRRKRVNQSSDVYTIAAGVEYYILMAKGHVSDTGQ